MSVCVYEYPNYKGASIYLRRGQQVAHSNFGSSNRWTTKKFCDSNPY